ncbi:MAG TPA: hypothetical protein VK666_29315 [Chryseolinea sp.]|nr:hypothetical protein [Chryseolinea sp.]
MLNTFTRSLLCTTVSAFTTFHPAMSQELPTYKEYVKKNIPVKKEIDMFLSDDLKWAKFDPVVGYTLATFMPHDGLDNSATISTVGANGARTSYMYANKPCRINTYGNSFTQCHQVSDGETWQEYLAANLGEPIRNFGMGGHGFYQAYRRMIREEKSKLAGEYVMMYIFGDDNIRSLMRCRYMSVRDWMDTMTIREGLGKMFHNNFWANLEMNLETGQIEEKPNRIPVAKDLYKMTDPDWMYKNLEDDLALQLQLFTQDKTRDMNMQKMNRLAEILKQPLTGLSHDDLQKSSTLLLNKYSAAAAKYVLKKSREFAEANNKKLMIILFDPGMMFNMAAGEKRSDQEVVDFLEAEKFNYFDMNLVHIEDYNKNFKISFEEYWKRFAIGHYSPAGNHFFAFSIKPKVVEWLNPKPITYSDPTEQMINFKDYLQK